MPSVSPDPREYIESHVMMDPNSGCWLWLGALSPSGYGHATQHNKPVRAHRLAYKTYHGPIPDGLFVMHKCDNPPCVNPAHLKAGTHSDNMVDSSNKGRRYFQRHPERSNLVGHSMRGLSHPSCKLTQAALDDIATSGLTNVALGEKHGVSAAVISKVRNGHWGKPNPNWRVRRH